MPRHGAAEKNIIFVGETLPYGNLSPRRSPDCYGSEEVMEPVAPTTPARHSLLARKGVS